MVGVAEDYLSTDIIDEFALMDTLHAADGAYRHEDRSFHTAVGHGEDACSGL